MILLTNAETKQVETFESHLFSNNSRKILFFESQDRILIDTKLYILSSFVDTNKQNNVCLHNCECGSNEIIIPKLQLSARRFIVDGVLETKTRDLLYASWDSGNYEFLNYNPEVWLFIYKTKKIRRKSDYYEENSFNRILKYLYRKKYIHPPHLNGIKYESSNFFSGNIDHLVPEIANKGYETEFAFEKRKGQRFLVPINLFDWFYYNDGSYYLLTDEVLNVMENYSIFRSNAKDLTIRAALAIVIDSPNSIGGKMFGEMSRFRMKLVSSPPGYQPENRIIYCI